MPKALLIATILCILCPFTTAAQSTYPYEQIIYGDFQKDILSYLADDLCEGRGCGKAGCQESAKFILERFRQWGLQPVNWKMCQSFKVNDSTVARNIFAMVPARKPSDRYIVVSAHYDHLGKLRKTIYNGADDNASGVTAMLSMARMFAQMRSDGTGPDKNIIFVAFDAHERQMNGSEYFVSHLKDLNINAKQIDCNINLDILGTNLEPVGENPEYIIAIGENTLTEKYRGLIDSYARHPQYRMDVDLSFYGSKKFTKMMYESGDQNAFARKGIPAVWFTSGFNRYTLKPTDDTEIIDFPLLNKRTRLIFNFVNSLCK